jgi:hypothetical protein
MAMTNETLWRVAQLFPTLRRMLDTSDTPPVTHQLEAIERNVSRSTGTRAAARAVLALHRGTPINVLDAWQSWDRDHRAAFKAALDEL